VFAELYWTPGVMLQAEDRIHRIGQTEAVEIHYLTADETTDSALWKLVKKKLNIVSAAIDSSFNNGDLRTSITTKNSQTQNDSNSLRNYFKTADMVDDVIDVTPAKDDLMRKKKKLDKYDDEPEVIDVTPANKVDKSLHKYFKAVEKKSLKNTDAEVEVVDMTTAVAEKTKDSFFDDEDFIDDVEMLNAADCL
jgi:hypothetical protein